jgi:hypothetical protein
MKIEGRASQDGGWPEKTFQLAERQQHRCAPVPAANDGVGVLASDLMRTICSAGPHLGMVADRPCHLRASGLQLGHSLGLLTCIRAYHDWARLPPWSNAFHLQPTRTLEAGSTLVHLDFLLWRTCAWSFPTPRL